MLLAVGQRGLDARQLSALLERGACVDFEEVQEHADAHGYPRAVAEVTDTARLVRAADVFAAKISPRAFRAPLAPQAAARQLFEEEQGGPIAAALIRAVGLYPQGDFVRLKNGEAAIVAHRTAPRPARQRL